MSHSCEESVLLSWAWLMLQIKKGRAGLCVCNQLAQGLADSIEESEVPFSMCGDHHEEESICTHGKDLLLYRYDKPPLRLALWTCWVAFSGGFQGTSLSQSQDLRDGARIFISKLGKQMQGETYSRTESKSWLSGYPRNADQIHPLGYSCPPHLFRRRKALTSTVNSGKHQDTSLPTCCNTFLKSYLLLHWQDLETINSECLKCLVG